MKPSFEQISYSHEESIIAIELNTQYFTAPWHFHPEYELVYIIESFGKRFIGDNIENFNSGDIIFLGPNLPHVWINDKIFYKSNTGKLAKCIVIHFDRYYFSKETLTLPEFKFVEKALQMALNGIKISGKDSKKITKYIKELPYLRDISKYTTLLNILEIIGESKTVKTLVGKGYTNNLNLKVPERLCKVINYVNIMYKKKISISDVADIASMNKAAFCRYFKEKTSKTFTKYLNEIRISYACKLLIDGKLNVTQTCYEYGFNNVSNFNRQFKNIINKTPVEYLKTWRV